MLEHLRQRLRRLLGPRPDPEDREGAPAPRTAAVALVAREWSDEQLRRAWDVSTHQLGSSDATAVARTVAMRAALLDEWSRRHPEAVDAWWPGQPPPGAGSG